MAKLTQTNVRPDTLDILSANQCGSRMERMQDRTLAGFMLLTLKKTAPKKYEENVPARPTKFRSLQINTARPKTGCNYAENRPPITANTAGTDFSSLRINNAGKLKEYNSSNSNAKPVSPTSIMDIPCAPEKTHMCNTRASVPNASRVLEAACKPRSPVTPPFIHETPRLETLSANPSRMESIPDQTLAGCMLLAMLKKRSPTQNDENNIPARPTKFCSLRINTARPTTVRDYAESKPPIKAATTGTDFTSLGNNAGKRKESKSSGTKPVSPTSSMDTLCVPEKARMYTRASVPKCSEATTCCKRRRPTTPPLIHEVPRVPETTCVPELPTKKQFGKIVCKKCNRLLRKAKKCCGRYSVALCIRVEQIPEAYRPRVTRSGAIRADFPSFAQASRYRRFLSSRMRRKRKMQFLVEFDEQSSKRQRHDSIQKFPQRNATANVTVGVKNATANVIIGGYANSNVMGSFSQTSSLSTTFP